MGVTQSSDEDHWLLIQPSSRVNSEIGEDEDWTAASDSEFELLTSESWTLVEGQLVASRTLSGDFTIIPSAAELASWIGKLRRARHYSVFREAPEHIRNSRDAVYAAVCGDAHALEYAPEMYQHDRDIVLAAVKRECRVFEDLTEEFRADRDVALLAVRGDGRQLQHAAEALHRDRELVKAAIKTDSKALISYPHELWDVELVLAAIPKIRNWTFRCFMDNEKVKHVFAQRSFVMAMVACDPMMLQFASRELRADKEVVRRAVKFNWQALQHAALEMQADEEVVRAALQQCPLALQFAARVLKDNYDLVLEIVKEDPQALKFASKRLQMDDVVSATAYAKFVSQRCRQ